MSAPHHPQPAGPVRLVVEHPGGTESLLWKGGTAPLTELLRREGWPLNTRCGQRGLCDGCMVELVRGRLAQTAGGAGVTAGTEPLHVRACEHRPAGAQTEVVLRVPARSLLAHEPQVVSEFQLNVPCAHAPLLAPPASGSSPRRTLGVAVDVGTTTVAVLLVDLADGRMVGRAAAFNRQMHLGDDVLTRINLCATDPAMLGQLQHAVVRQTIAPLLAEAIKSNGGGGEAAGGCAIAGFCVAGNTTMLHLLAGVDPTPMGVAPFTPVFTDHRVLTAGQIGLDLHRHAAGGNAPASEVPVHLLPGAAAYIGADLVAGILASGLLYDDGPSLLVDVGTNGEIILKHQDRILGCATAAGPAFEGARLTSGIRAGRGAISDIALSADPFALRTQVIGHDRPIGVCGSAYIDFLAQGRKVGLLSAAGRFQPEALGGAAADLLRADGHNRSLRVAQGRGNADIVISETDIAALLQAKAAIAAGVLTLLERAGLRPADVRHLYVAGGFGTHLDHANAIGCGLLPGFTAAQIQVVGNSALAGAYLALMDRSALDEMKRLARRVEIVELNLAPGFEDRYIEQLMLP